MRSAMLSALTLALLAAFPLAASAGSSIVTLGSSIGLNVYSQDGSTAYSLSTDSPFSLGVAEPNLRIGMILPRKHLELATLLGTTLLGSQGTSWSSLGLTLDGNYCFGGAEGVCPYIGAHAGASLLSAYRSTDHVTRIGMQLGSRRPIVDGHGAVRGELRASLVQGEGATSLSDVGARLGAELWFR